MVAGGVAVAATPSLAAQFGSWLVGGLEAVGTSVILPVAALLFQMGDKPEYHKTEEKKDDAKTEEAKPAKEKAKDRRARESEESRENKSEAKRPGDNKRQNKQFKDATRDKSPADKRKIHEQMKKMEHLDYRDLVNLAKD